MSDEIVGGTPGCCGYAWDEERQLWHRPWEKDGITISGTANHWFNNFIPKEDDDEAERR